MSYNEGSFTGSRGQSLFYREYLPIDRPKAFLVWHHGYGAHSGLTDGVFKRIRDSGIGVFAYDADSFGRSCTNEKLRSLVTDISHMPADVFAFVQEVISKRQPGPKVPLFMGGHSMGGMVSILSAIKQPKLWQGIVMTAPVVDAERTFALKVLRVLQPLLLLICPNARLVPAIPVELTTPLPEMRKKQVEDPLVDLDGMRVRMAVTFLQGFADVEKRESEIKLPIYVAYSAEDKVVSAPAIDRFVSDVQSTDVEVNRFDKGMHDLLLGPEEPEVTSGIIAWIHRHS